MPSRALIQELRRQPRTRRNPRPAHHSQGLGDEVI